MAVTVRTLLLLSTTAATANAGWAHGWRDQYIRVSQRLGQKVAAEIRHARKLGLLGEDEGAPEHLKQKARDAVRHAERVHHAQRHNARELSKPEHQRRKLMDVECSGRTCARPSNACLALPYLALPLPLLRPSHAPMPLPVHPL